MSLRRSIVAAAMLGVALALVTYAALASPDVEAGQRYASEIRRLMVLDQGLHANVLAVRFGMRSSYDSLVESLDEARRAEAALADTPALGDEAGTAVVRQRLREHVSQLDREAQLVERFKSRYAVLRNSLRYFPSAASVLSEDLSARAETLAIGEQLGELLRDILLYTVTANDDIAPAIRRRVHRIEALAATLGSEGRRVAALLAHANAILANKPRVDSLVRAILDTPSARTAQRLHAAHESVLTDAVRTLGVYRKVLWTTSASLVVGLLVALVYLRRNARLLASTNAGLETRVRERTAALQHGTEELDRAREAAEAARSAQSEFLANMSHEIRTPMTAVLGYADLLLDGNLSSVERTRHVQTIRRNGDHLLSVINDILDLSKIQAGKMTVEKVDCSPASIVAEVASLMRSRSIEKGVELEIYFEGPVPETMKSDPTRVRQILLNLVGNAIKFTSRGSVWVLVRCLDAASQSPTVSIEVADSGIGMTDEQLASLFRPFTQADTSTTRRFGGSGLGLAISARLAAMLGGSITVSSVVGRGSCFTLSLDPGPLDGIRMIEGLREAGLPLREPVVEASPTRVHANILLAEDGPDNQLLVSTYLRKAGARVAVVDNGRLAVEAAIAALSTNEPFDLVLMDMQMPELDGYSATRILRANRYSGAIVALTAHAMAGDRAKCLAAGCDDYLAKPVQRDALLAMAARFGSTAAVAPGESPTHPDASSAPIDGLAHPTRTDSRLVSDLAGDPDMTELIGEFSRGLPERARVLQDHLDRSELGQLGRMAHQLKGAAAGYGFPTITKAAATLERLLNAGGSADEICASVRSITRLCLRVGPQTIRQEG